MDMGRAGELLKVGRRPTEFSCMKFKIKDKADAFALALSFVYSLHPAFAGCSISFIHLFLHMLQNLNSFLFDPYDSWQMQGQKRLGRKSRQPMRDVRNRQLLLHTLPALHLGQSQY